MSRPSKTILPAVGSSSFMIVRPSVVLPQPDSPTMPSVSPARTVRSTPSTARTCPTVCLKTPALIGKCLTRPSTRRSRRRSTTTRRCRRGSLRLAHDRSAGATRIGATRAPRRSGTPRVIAACSAARSSGISVRQTARPCDCAQRGWNAQPGGGVIRLGGWPGIGSSRSLSASSRRGWSAARRCTGAAASRRS